MENKKVKRKKSQNESKEADETEYWLELLYKTGYLDENQYQSIQNDTSELIKILTSIIKKLKSDT